MKEQKTIYLLNDADVEVELHAAMEELDVNKASELLNEIDRIETALDQEYIQNIKDRTIKKIGQEDTASTIKNNNTKEAQQEPQIETLKETQKEPQKVTQKESALKRKSIRWKRYAAAAAIIMLSILVSSKHDSIVLAFQNMLSLIPGVGIVPNNQEVKYRLKEQAVVENDQYSLKILYVTATDGTMTVRFDLEGSLAEEQEQSEEKKMELLNKMEVYLLVDNQKFQKYKGGSGTGISGSQFSYNGNYTFEVDQKYINTKNDFTLECEEYNIQVNFSLSKIDEYSSPGDIGSTETHNNISLTADAFLKDGQLSVNIYPMNNSEYNLISFVNEYNLEYFKKKMTLNTDKGIKGYIPPSYYGTDLNAPFLFDVSDGSGDFTLSIPFVVVETDEEKEISLPIPEEGKKVKVDKVIEFDNGSAIIKSVKRLAGDIGNEDGYLQIFLEYTNLNDKQQLVGVEFTGKDAIGFYPFYDDQNRETAVSYMLKESDNKELKLSVIKPRYVLMDSYQLEINIKK